MTEPIKFFLPGPTYVPEDARQAMTQPMVGHRSPGFKDFYIKLSAKLPKLLRTSGDVMVASGSSTLVMESAVISCVQQDVLCLTNGAFSERWHSIAKSTRQVRRQARRPLGTGDRPRGAARRPAPQEVRGHHRGPQRDLDRRDEPDRRPRQGRSARRGTPWSSSTPSPRSAARRSRPTTGGSTSASPAPRRRSPCRPA